MNKLFAIAFMCIYLLLSVGVAKTTHYCMGRQKSTKIFSFESEKCGCSLFFPTNNSCCDDTHEFLIIDDFQAQTVAFTPSLPQFFQVRLIHSEENKNEIIEQTITQFLTPDFLPPPKEPLFKTNCSFVFYDRDIS